MRASLWWRTIIWEVHLMIYIINWRFYTEQREARSSLLINYLPVRGRGLPNIRASYNVRYEKILLLIFPLLELNRPGGQLQGEHMGKFNLQTEERQMSTVPTLSAIRLCVIKNSVIDYKRNLLPIYHVMSASCWRGSLYSFYEK